MPKLLAYWWPLLGFTGAVVCAVPLAVAVMSVRWDALHYCLDRAPESVDEGVGVGWSISYFPVGIECRYGSPISATGYHDFGTPVLVIGLLVLAAAVAGAIVRLVAYRYDW